MGLNKQSSLTFKELFGETGYLKVIWNNEIVYNEYDNPAFEILFDCKTEDCKITENVEDTLNNLSEFKKEYYNKVVYSAKVKVVEFHHLILDIKGE